MGKPSGVPREHFWLAEVAKYLNVAPRVALRFVKKNRLGHRLPCWGKGHDWVVSEYGAMLVIAHFRAMQGQMWLDRGRCYHERIARKRAADKRHHAKRNKAH